MLVPFQQKTEIGKPQPGDWRCPGCNDLQFAKNPTCRKCGERKPQSAELQEALAATTDNQLAVLTPAQSPVIAQLCQGEEWQCPMCKEISFANRVSCRRCGCPRPEGPTVVKTVEHQLASGGYIGYLPDVSKVEAVSGWAKQWDTGILPGALTIASIQHQPAPFDPDAASEVDSESSTTSSSSSSSDSSGSEKKKKIKKKKLEEKTQQANTKDDCSSSSSSGSSSGDEQARKKAKTTCDKSGTVKTKAKSNHEGKVKAGAGDKSNGNTDPDKEAKRLEKERKRLMRAKAKAKAEKKMKKALDVEEELEKRRLQKERRKKRVVAVL